MAIPLTLEQKLEAAETAYHKLMTGESARVVVDQNGERVEFTAINVARLAEYIERLKSQISGKPKGPARIWF
jgi:hypothetical protein